MANPADEAPPPKEPSAEINAAAAPPAQPNAPAVDSTTFSRCAACRSATEVNSSAGTLLCKKHNMLINAEADEIPDDCGDYEAKDG
jgi:hypothetical protein